VFPLIKKSFDYVCVREGRIKKNRTQNYEGKGMKKIERRQR
jgi:hypothetical protein